MRVDIEAAVAELTDGAGYLLIEGFYSPAEVREAHDLIYRLAEDEPQRTSHFHGDETVVTQQRIWNLIEKGEVFRRMVADERLLSVLPPILGDDFTLASYCANILFPGAPAQEPHVDYPYWDLHERSHFPRALNASFFLEVETLAMLDDFTVENGATALAPGSQKLAQWPTTETFDEQHIRITGPAGSLLLFPALTWHAGQRNASALPRAALLGAYTCKFVRPLEDWQRGLSPQTVAHCDARLRSLLGLDMPYPKVMDELPGVSSGGQRSHRRVNDPAAPTPA